VIIAAVAENNVIGRSTGEMPWHSKEEFQHFKNTTIGFPVIMGRKTFESLGQALKGRLNIVVTSNSEYRPNEPEVVVVQSLKEAYKYCSEKGFEKIFIIGGGYIFRETINEVDEMIISRMKFNAIGDVYFPDINPDKWEIVNQEDRSEFVIYHYVKKR
jgi:dihydrofolate reductase